MSDKQQRFIEEYLIDCNGAAAARRAGYSESTARQKAYELLNDEAIAVEIKTRLTQIGMSLEVATKHISDIASTRLNDYMVVKKVLRTPIVRKSLQSLIEELEQQIELEEEYIQQADAEEGEITQLQRQQKDRRNKILRYTLELKRNPMAYRDLPGESEWVDHVEVDLAALAKDKEKGRIKTLTFGEYGPKVEMYAADAALRTIIEMHGGIIQKVQHIGNGPIEL